MRLEAGHIYLSDSLTRVEVNGFTFDNQRLTEGLQQCLDPTQSGDFRSVQEIDANFPYQIQHTTMSSGGMIIDNRELARTYDGSAYADPYETVQEYRAVMRYASQHPNKGSHAVAPAIDTPRSRIRTWIDRGGAPDCVRGLETAREYGWLEADYDDPECTALNTLVANVFSGGSIADQHYQPSFALNHRGEESHVINALELAGVDYQVVDGREGRADEARPTEDASVLGRVLAVLGAPVGSKTDTRLSLPDYLEGAYPPADEPETAFQFDNRSIRLGSQITIDTADYVLKGTVQQLQDDGTTLNTERTSVQLESNVSATTANAIEIGDEYQFDGQTIATVTGVETTELENTSKVAVDLEADLVTFDRAGTKTFGGRSLSIGTQITLRTESYDFSGELTHRGPSELIDETD